MSAVTNDEKLPASTLQPECYLHREPVTFLEKIGVYLAKINGWILISLAIAMVSCITWQVISRYFLDKSSTHTDELARFLFMWIGLLGAVQATAYKKHLAIDLMLMRLHGKLKIFLVIFIEICILIFAITVMVYGGGNLAAKTFASQQITPSLRIPMGYVYAIVPITGLLISFYSITTIYSAIKFPQDYQE